MKLLKGLSRQRITEEFLKADGRNQNASGLSEGAYRNIWKIFGRNGFPEKTTDGRVEDWGLMQRVLAVSSEDFLHKKPMTCSCIHGEEAMEPWQI